MASVLLLLPDELLADIDAIRQGPRLEWIRSALTEKLRTAEAHTTPTNRIPGASERRTPPAAPPRRARMMTRQGTLPGGDLCAHPFRDSRNICKLCGHQR
jgi:hypothetical protein